MPFRARDLRLWNPFMHDLLVIAVAGVITGVLGAVFGVGGGMFLIPVLVFGLHLPMHNAVAVSIVTVIATSSAVASTNVERGTANMRLGMTLEIATTSGAIVGGLVAGLLSATMLETLFAVVLLPTVVLMWRGGEEGHIRRDSHGAPEGDGSDSCEPAREDQTDIGMHGGHYQDVAESGKVSYRVKRLWAGLGISFIAGSLSGLLGTGGGAFHVPGMHLACGVPVKAATATSNFMIGVTAAASAFLYYGRGQIVPGVTAVAVLGVLVGSAAGSFINVSIRGGVVRRIFAGLLALLALYMFYHVWNGD